jgi:2',3'-cyclic-nucleotide 2'-phosphodiesterase
MRILFIGDIVGPPGMGTIKRMLPGLVAAERIDLVIADAENAYHGSGLTPGQYGELREAGVDLITLGDHIYKRHEIIAVLQREENICKPANFPSLAPGREFAQAMARDGTPAVALCLLGRLFMRPVDCQFQAVDRVLKAIPPEVRCVVVDMHAEATAEKCLMAHYLKGRVTAVLGTHTHVATADEQILPGGTAFITDVGMTGPYDSILGRRIDRVLSTSVNFVPSQFDVATGDPRLAGAILDVDPATGKATQIRRLMLRDGDCS